MLIESLEMYIGAGLSVDAALRAAAGGVPEKRRPPLQHLLRSVEGGGTIGDSLGSVIHVPPVVCALIVCGESAGDLAGGFAAARKVMEREDDLRKKCLSALAYPMIIGLAAAGLTLWLMRGIMPQITPMLRGLRVELPIMTRIVMRLSEGMVMFGAYGAIVLVILVAAIVFAYRRSPVFRYRVHALVMSIPLVGRSVRSYGLGIFLGSCGALVESGMSLPQACRGAASATPLLPLRAVLTAETLAVERGTGLGVALSLVHVPAYVTSLVSAGEVSGSLGVSLLRASSIIDRDLEHALRRMTSLIEPVMMAGMGCAVGAVAVSIMMPIYDISKAIQQ